jgi:hypothetical protein
VISAIRIVSVSLHLFGRDGNVLSVFSALCVDVAVDVLDFGRVAVGIIATAGGRMIWHVPRWIEFLVQELILRRMVVKSSPALSILRLDPHRQQATETAR